MRKRLIILISMIVSAILGIFGIRYYLDARIPRATVTLEVKPYPLPWSYLPSSSGSRRPYPGYLSSEFVPLADALSIAAQALEDNETSLGETVSYWNNNVDFEPVRGTDFFRIIAKHPSRSQAILIANTVAEAIVVREAEIRRSRTADALEALDEELELQAEIVDENFKAFQIICEQYGVGLPLPNAPALTRLDLEMLLVRIWEKENPGMNVCYDNTFIGLNYFRARDDYEQSREILREMKIKQEEARVLLKMPHSPVTIHERAK